jgi:hypothetical protein
MYIHGINWYLPLNVMNACCHQHTIPVQVIGAHPLGYKGQFTIGIENRDLRNLYLVHCATEASF